jgi:hypothetical protein
VAGSRQPLDALGWGGFFARHWRDAVAAEADPGRLEPARLVAPGRGLLTSYRPFYRPFYRLFYHPS